jgi:ribosomal protein S18 acetylase RimI-like enzyme
MDHAPVSHLYALSLAANPQGFIQKLSYHGDIVANAQGWIAQGGDLRVAKLADAVIGMGGLRPITPTRAELCKLHLHPHYHGQGLGKKLSIDLLDRAGELGFTLIELHVTETQQAAIGLYKKLGFVETKRDIWRTTVDGQDLAYPTLYMEKTL